MNHYQSTLPKFNLHRLWLIALIVAVLLGSLLVSDAEAQGNGTDVSDPLTAQATQPTSDSTGGTIVFQTGSGGPIYAINADGTNLRYLTTGLDPALSPDGQWVAFTRWETSQDGALGSVWIINIDGSGERLIHENVYNPRTPVWSSDGSRLVISFQNGGRTGYELATGSRRPGGNTLDVEVFRDEDGDVEYRYLLLPDPHWSLRQIDVATGASEDLSGDLYSLSPDWDPTNGAHLIYDGEAGLVNLDLTTNTTAALTGDVNDHSPVFSPNGSQIAVSYYQNDHWEIHLMNADGSNAVRLTQTGYQTWVEQELNGQTPHSYNNAAPAWSPDGTRIAFLTDRTGQWEIWVMNADGSNQQPLFPAETLAGISLHYNGADEQMLAWR
jgi:Tol biopolymer transport system component